uniref:Uncharacterized protein n=1 Tax=Arundo donax TaxID=35708 RepID=A0A0A9E559_ARUDO
MLLFYFLCIVTVWFDMISHLTLETNVLENNKNLNGAVASIHLQRSYTIYGNVCHYL